MSRSTPRTPILDIRPFLIIFDPPKCRALGEIRLISRPKIYGQNRLLIFLLAGRFFFYACRSNTRNILICFANGMTRNRKILDFDYYYKNQRCCQRVVKGISVSCKVPRRLLIEKCYSANISEFLCRNVGTRDLLYPVTSF